MFERTRERGSVVTTLKRGKAHARARPRAERRRERELSASDMARDASYGVIARARSGKRKVSTFVAKDRAERFVKSLQTIQLAYMDGLAKAKKKKKKPKTAPVAPKPRATNASTIPSTTPAIAPMVIAPKSIASKPPGSKPSASKPPPEFSPPPGARARRAPSRKK